ncbi:hypothetical protein [Enterobacter sp. PTB]
MKLFWAFWISGNVWFWMVKCVNGGYPFGLWLMLVSIAGLLPYLLWRVLR